MTITTYPEINNQSKIKRVALRKLSRTAHLAELKISYRTKVRERPSQRINSPELAIEYLRQLWDKETLELREEFVLVCLSNALTVNGWIKLHSGGLQDCPVDIRLILGVALQTASSAILVAHNHPSGQVLPSQADRKLTVQIAQACRLLGIRLLDHVILTADEAFSFQEKEPGTMA